MKLSQHLKTAKAIVSIIWLFIVASLIAPSQIPFPYVFQGIGVFLVIAHIIEIVIYRKRMRGVKDYLLTMLFGLLQLKQIRLERLNYNG